MKNSQKRKAAIKDRDKSHFIRAIVADQMLGNEITCV